MMHRVARVTLCLVLFAAMAASFAAADEVRSWHDRLMGKDWVLTPTGEEVLVIFAEGTSEAAREALALAEGLAVSHPYNGLYRTAVYRAPAGADVAALAGRLPSHAEIDGAAPAVFDSEGYVKYYIPGQLLVQLDKAMSDEACRAAIAAAGSEVIEDYWTPGFYKIATPAGKDLFRAIREWYDDPRLLFSEPAYMCYNDAAHVPNDTHFPQQWALRNTAQQGGWTAGADVQAVEAWDLQRGSPNVIVVVIDTGMDLNHEDLAPNLLPRDGHDWDFASGDNSPDDEDAHGTACSGIAVAVQDNGLGVSGIAPGCRIMPLRINLSSGQNGNRADAINYAASRRVDFDGLVMSNSWIMSSGDFTAVEAAVQNAHALDCVVLFASGNDNGAIRYPAKYPETIAVGASSPCDERKNMSSCDGENFWGSNYGPELDVVAPGVKIYTTDRTGGAGYSSGNYYPTFNGTSSACPLAAGICALILSANPTLTNVEVREILRASSEDLVGRPSEDTPGWDPYMGWGRVNAYQAVLMAAVEDGFEDDMESGAGAWTHYQATPAWNDPWHLSTQRNHTEGGASSWKCGSQSEEPYGGSINAALVSPLVRLPDNPVLSFWHYLDADVLDDGIAADGGLLEISTNNGGSWSPLEPLGGYTHIWGPSTLVPFTQGTPLFSGNHDWRPCMVDLADYAGMNVRVRFRFGSRSAFPPGAGAEGWYIDDVLLGELDVSAVGDPIRNASPLVLWPAAPNPSSGSVVVRFSIPEEAAVLVRVADVTGREIVAHDLGRVSPGERSITWDGRDAAGRSAPTGIYFVRVQAGERVAGERLVRVR